MSGKPGSFPLRAGFFRSPPLSAQDKLDYYKEGQQLADNLIRMADHQRWRLMPPEKDGIQLCKDTSNLDKSMRMVRAAITLTCSMAELNKIFTHTSTETFRSFCRRLFASDFIDCVCLHTVSSPSALAGADPSLSGDGSGSASESIASSFQRAVEYVRSSAGGEHFALTKGEQLATYALYQLAVVGPCNTPKPEDAEEAAKWEAWNKISVNHTNEEAKVAYVQFLSTKVPNWRTATDGENQVSSSAVSTLKWAAFQAGITSSNRDLCCVDFKDTRKDENGSDIGIWCFKSVDGHKAGCMSLQESHGLHRAQLARIGLLWRQIGQQGEVEVIFVGSLPSKHAKSISQHFMAALNRLALVVEDLRIERQRFVQRSQWVDDRERPGCNLCLRNFSAFRRKHHCRMCGEVICGDCSVVRSIHLAVVGQSKLRLCKACLAKAKRTPLAESEIDDSAASSEGRMLRKNPSESTYGGVPGNQVSELSNMPDLEGLGIGDRGHSRSGAASAAGDHSVSSQASSLVEDRPSEDASRLTDIASLNSTSHENMFDLLCDLACQALDCPVASVSVLEGTHERVRSCKGVTDGNIARELAACGESFLKDKPVVILDVQKEKRRTSSSGSAALGGGIGFFAGTPICERSGTRVGTICVADRKPREKLGADDLIMMEKLATLALKALEERRSRTQSGSMDGGSAGKPSTSTAMSVDVGRRSRDTELAYPLERQQAYMSTEEKMKNLLWKSYETQQQMANPRNINGYR